MIFICDTPSIQNGCFVDIEQHRLLLLNIAQRGLVEEDAGLYEVPVSFQK